MVSAHTLMVGKDQHSKNERIAQAAVLVSDDPIQNPHGLLYIIKNFD